MGNNIFRKQSIDRVAAPEQLDDYIKIANPSVWIILAAIVVLLAPVLIWSIYGVLPTTFEINTYVQDGSAVAYVDSETAAMLRAGLSVQVGNHSGTLEEVAELPISSMELAALYANDYLATSLTAGEWNYSIRVRIPEIPDGLYSMRIVMDTTKPIAFIAN